MSKAFTKEDDNTGFSPPSSSVIGAVGSSGPFRITATGARAVATHSDPRVREALGRAITIDPVHHPERAALGVTVHARSKAGATRMYRLVSPEERALLGDGCSVEGPIGRALLGAVVGDVCEVSLPRGMEELEILALDGE